MLLRRRSIIYQFPRNRSSYLAETDNWGKADGECRECFPQGLVLRSDLTAFGETCRLGRRFQRSLVPLDRFVFRVRCNFLLALASLLPVTSASCTFQLRRESHEISLKIDRSTSACFPFPTSRAVVYFSVENQLKTASD